MTPRLAVIRPEPGNARTSAALRAAGADVLSLPLFVVRPVEWTLPDLTQFDALLLTSANAVRHSELRSLTDTPVVAVGPATADAARRAGFIVVVEGRSDAAAAVAQAETAGYGRLVHLAGRDRIALPGVEAVTVYASDPRTIAADAVAVCSGRTVLVHSVRAASRLAELIDQYGLDRNTVAIAALSAAVADAAGNGWQAKVTSPTPTDGALIATALASAIDRADRDEDNARQ